MNDVRRAALKRIAICAVGLAPAYLIADAYDRSSTTMPGWVTTLVMSYAIVPFSLILRATGEVLVGRKWVGHLNGGFEPPAR